MRTSLFLAVLLLPLPLWATVWHVYQGQSIQAAINGAVAGDDVIVHPGTYHESLTLKAGVDVYSTNGSSETTINGGGATQTVYYTGNGAGMAFGGVNVGFRIEGGSQYGVILSGCSNALFGDLEIVSDPSGAALRCYSCTQPLGFTQLRVHGQSGQCLWAVDIHESQLVFVNSFIYDISRYYGIYASDSNLLFQSVEIHDCNTGLKSAHTYVTYEGGSIHDCAVSGVSAYTLALGAGGTLLDFEDVEFSNCTVGLNASGGGTEWPWLRINIAQCYLHHCEDGMDLERCWGDVKGCTFSDIYDTAVRLIYWELPQYSWVLLQVGGPAAGESNQFTNVDGVGVHLGSLVQAVVNSDFDNVTGTGILCEPGGGSVTISGSDFDGSGYCYEGIATRGPGTMATIRGSEVYDYAAHIWPEPHGVAVRELTANLGTMADPGMNSLHNNCCDLLYTSRKAVPDDLYAQNNWWGESPPDQSSFCGSAAAYIVYDPWLGAPPRAMHGTEPGPASPDVASLSLASPNPTNGTVGFSYSLNMSGPVELGIWDLQGRLVKALVAGLEPTGKRAITWDGTDETGRPAASGTYVARLICLAGDAACRFVLVR